MQKQPEYCQMLKSQHAEQHYASPHQTKSS